MIGPRSDLDLLVVRETSIVAIERATDLVAPDDVALALARARRVVTFAATSVGELER